MMQLTNVLFTNEANYKMLLKQYEYYVEKITIKMENISVDMRQKKIDERNLNESTDFMETLEVWLEAS